MKLAILDYGSGNIFSLKTSFERCNVIIDVITSLNDLTDHCGLLLPGVGNFDPAMKNINKCSEKSKEYFMGGKIPTLGICLGMEILFQQSQEGVEKGLGIMNGDVVLLSSDRKIPHMGWNNLKKSKPSRLLDEIKDDSWVYFTHSYMITTPNPNLVTAVVDYGIMVPAVVEKDNFFGTQFHPEKSSKIGLQIIKKFLEVCKK